MDTKVLTNSLREIIPPEDRIILLHSALWTFGHHFGKIGKSFPREILNRHFGCPLEKLELSQAWFPTGVELPPDIFQTEQGGTKP